MKAIVTRYYGPTNTRGARIQATAEGGHRVSLSYPHEFNKHEAHAQAAIALCQKLKWKGELISGGLPDGDVVFVFAHSDRFTIPEAK